MLKLEKVSKAYITPEGKLPVLRDLTADIPAGSFISVMGPSGSGKSTFLGIAAGLDKPDSGKILIDGDDITQKTENELAVIRSQKIGFIFQNFQLIKNLTALENVALPLLIGGKLKDNEIMQRAEEILIKVSLKDRMKHLPGQLSGGEEQRVALARAFINNPKLLFADEPTGNLDARNGEIVMKMLIDLNKTFGSTLIIVTHDPVVSSFTDKVLEMRDGRLMEKPKQMNPYYGIPTLDETPVTETKSIPPTKKRIGKKKLSNQSGVKKKIKSAYFVGSAPGSTESETPIPSKKKAIGKKKSVKRK
ncbi:MAG: ABC transporter ATP-binding protein [Leptospiraceae bacterium]|nr:ABC transporter ATP-binding protein [Leptospiraceae bacterium]MCP5512901.1 ABC transporter ATP-binding protein [Leptospiraceae bacterium]